MSLNVLELLVFDHVFFGSAALPYRGAALANGLVRRILDSGKARTPLAFDTESGG